MLKKLFVKVNLLFLLLFLAGCQNMGTSSTPTAEASNAAAQEQTAITLHLAQQQADPELVAVELGSDQRLYALPNPVLTQADLREAAPVNTEDGASYVVFAFTQEGSKKLANITEQARGHFFLLSANGQLLSVVQIAEPMTNGQLVIQTNSPEHSQQVMQLLR